MAKKPKQPKEVRTLTHDDATRRNIPSAELQSVAQRIEEDDPFRPVAYRRRHPLPEGKTRERDTDLDPQIVWNGLTITLTDAQRDQLVETGRIELGDAQLVWRGKDTQDWSDLVVQAPPVYIQEKIHPKAIIDDLKRHTKARAETVTDAPDLFADFNGIDPDAKTEFYAHDQNWSNRMILGDSLQAMASLAEREALRGQVQCIYFDPPYGIKFNSNWQVSTRSRDVKDGKQADISREPEQVKAFRDTWKDGIHSYLTYLRDRLTIMRDMLTESGSIFVQIGDENVHRVRAVMDEVFGEESFVSTISVQKTYGFSTGEMSNVLDYILWFARNRSALKTRRVCREKPFVLGEGNATWLLVDPNSYRSVSSYEIRGATEIPAGSLPYNPDNLISQGRAREPQPLALQGIRYDPWDKNSHWKPNYPEGLDRLIHANRVHVASGSFRYRRFHTDTSLLPYSNIWSDTGTGNFTDDKIYVVQTGSKIIQRCLLMATDPGDLVLDPTCGSGTTAFVAEQWGRRWITMDTSRVALALARSRLMGARYPYYLLADSEDGRAKEQEISQRVQADTPTHNDVRHGFVYRRAPHITLKSIANNAEIDVIWDNWQAKLEPLRAELNQALGRTAERTSSAEAGEDGPWEEWEIPHEAEDGWSDNVKGIHAAWWEARIARQKEIDASIADRADVEMLYDRPYEDTSKVRVAGPFTVESLSPHRMIAADEDDAAIRAALDEEAGLTRERETAPGPDFAQMVIDSLLSAGVHQSRKDDRLGFTAVTGWPGNYVGAEGRYLEGTTERRAAIFVGPEFGTVTRADLTAAAREAYDARFDVLVACGFAFDAHTSELNKLGPLPILKARMNPDLHMSDQLKNTGKGNLFVVFGEPDIEWKQAADGEIVVEVLGVDVFDPKTGEVRASGKDDIAAWFIDTDYDEESFFVRHAYFMGANDPYKSLKTALNAEIDREAWETLYRDTSRPFPRPSTGRFAVKVINHFGDEVMKVFGV